MPWEERHRRLDGGDIDVAFICGLPYSQKHDRPDRPLELLCARPAMAGRSCTYDPIREMARRAAAAGFLILR